MSIAAIRDASGILEANPKQLGSEPRRIGHIFPTIGNKVALSRDRASPEPGEQLAEE